MQLLDKIMECFTEQQVVSFATIEDMQPRVRPMTLINIDNRFYMITGARGGRDAKKLQQIRQNPRFEYYLTLKGVKNDGFIRGMGETWELEDLETRKRLYDKVTWAANFFENEDHPEIQEPATHGARVFRTRCRQLRGTRFRPMPSCDTL